MPTDEKPSRNEEEYFARQEAELVRELRARRDEERAQQQRTEASKCPRDGTALREEERESVRIDICPTCGGIWLDQGELEILQKTTKGGGLLGSFLSGGRK